MGFTQNRSIERHTEKYKAELKEDVARTTKKGNSNTMKRSIQYNVIHLSEYVCVVCM